MSGEFRIFLLKKSGKKENMSQKSENWMLRQLWWPEGAGSSLALSIGCKSFQMVAHFGERFQNSHLRRLVFGPKLKLNQLKQMHKSGFLKPHASPAVLRFECDRDRC
jgi:hypothetical protein